MNDDHLETYIEPELEARIVALVLGEASAFEREELERLMEEQAEVKLFHDRIAKLHEMLREVPDSREDPDWTLPEDKRAELMDTFAGMSQSEEEPEKTGAAARRRKIIGIRMLAAAAIVTTLAVPLAIAFMGLGTSEIRSGSSFGRMHVAQLEDRAESESEYLFFDGGQRISDLEASERPVREKYVRLRSEEMPSAPVRTATASRPGEEKESASGESDSLFARHFLGGAGNLRGFDYQEVGAAAAKKNESLGFSGATQNFAANIREESRGQEFDEKAGRAWMHSKSKSTPLIDDFRVDTGSDLNFDGRTVVGQKIQESEPMGGGGAAKSRIVAGRGVIAGGGGRSGDGSQGVPRDLGESAKEVTDVAGVEVDSEKLSWGAKLAEVEKQGQARVSIEGNDRTRDHGVRRELSGEELGVSDAKGRAPDVSFSTEKDLLARVTKSAAGSVQFGGGASTIDSLNDFTEITEQNLEMPDDGKIRLSVRGGRQKKSRSLFAGEQQAESSLEFGFVTNTEDVEVDRRDTAKSSRDTAALSGSGKPITGASTFSAIAMPEVSEPEFESRFDADSGMAGGGIAFGVQNGKEFRDSDFDLPTKSPADGRGTIQPSDGTIALGAGGKIVAKSSTGSIHLEREADSDEEIERSGSLEGADVELRSHGNFYASAINGGGVARAAGVNQGNRRARIHSRGISSTNGGTIVSDEQKDSSGAMLFDDEGRTKGSLGKVAGNVLWETLREGEDLNGVINQTGQPESQANPGALKVNREKQYAMSGQGGARMTNELALRESKELAKTSPEPGGDKSSAVFELKSELERLDAQVGTARSKLNRPKEAVKGVKEIEQLGQELAEARTMIEEGEVELREKSELTAVAKVNRGRAEQLAANLDTLRKDQETGVTRGEFQSTIAKTYSKWGFAVVKGGKNQGVVRNSQLDVYRRGAVVGKLLVTSVEDEQAVAEIIPGTVRNGFTLQPGDTVVKSLNTPKTQSSPDPTLIARESDAGERPFSTFSLHVSDVSFKLAHASLTKGEWPDQSRIRIEEFVNAFDYDDPLPTPDERVSAMIEQAIHPSMQQRNVLRISLRTAAAGRNSGTPLSLTFLLDSSGSMERFDRQETLRRAFSLLAAQLNQHDKVNLISFARQPRLVAEAVAGNRCSDLVDLVSQLPEEGGTNLESALVLAFEKAKQHRSANSQNRIILLTDGAANLGDADPERLSGMVQSMRDAGIAFDAAGIGAEGLNDEILEALTRKGDGRYYLLDRPEDADAGFAKQIAGALRPAAGNVKVQVEFNPERVGKYQLHGFEKHRLKKEDFRNDKVDAAELAAAEAGVALYQVETLPEGRGDIGQVSVRFRDMQSGRMVEKRWPIPYQASLPHVFNAGESIRLATVATLVASKLKGEPLGSLSQWDELAGIVGSLSPDAQKRERIVQLNEMIARAKEISGTSPNPAKSKAP